MEINKGIRAKLFLLFIIIGALPFIILVVMSARNTYDDLKEYSKQTGLLKNAIISGHITELIEKNRLVLQSVANAPEVIQYLKDPTPQRRAAAEEVLYDTNEVFGDANVMALTGADAWQLIRTDGATLVNLSKRQHFKEAMKGRSYVSDVISSISTGNTMVVLESPVLDEDEGDKPIGMIQRNFDLSALDDYVRVLDDEDTYIILMDRNGRIIANSNSDTSERSGQIIDSSYKFILDRIYNSSGAVDLSIDGQQSLVTYSRNVNTGWMIITVRPYHHLMIVVGDKATKAVIFGLSMLFIGTLFAFMLSVRVTRPIIEMTNTIDEIVSGKADVDKIEVFSNDELGQMAKAFNKMKSDRDAFQLESELDRLTELYNKKTIENLCRMKLKVFNENAAPNVFMAFYIIDLDHFKEVNDLLGHQFGDKVLIEFSTGLKKIFRPNDCIGRFGGDEFIVILDGLPNTEIVIRKAEQIKQIAFNLTVEGKSHIVTASIGIAIAPQSGRDYDTLFAAADKAVYHVKNNGKNGYYCELFADDNNNAV